MFHRSTMTVQAGHRRVTAYFRRPFRVRAILAAADSG